MVRVAAVQLEAVLADVDANLAACARLGTRAGEAGAEVIAFPEFFTTGIGFTERLAPSALPPDGPATELLTGLAARFGALVGGTFLCRDADGEVRNAYLLAGPDGVVGRHDKDLPLSYRGRFEGATVITDADGRVLAERPARDGEGVVVAEVTPGRRTPVADPPRGFWLHRRGALPTACWHYQRWHGERWYRRHRVAAELVSR